MRPIYADKYVHLKSDRTRVTVDITPQPQSAFVLHPDVRSQPLPRTADDMLAEACRLAEAISLEVVLAETVRLAAPKAPTFLGPGYLERIAELAEDYHEPLIIVNCSLSPVQQRNLETRLSCKVIDRTALILEIFGARAQTHAGRLQVELAALSFQRSRLVRSWTHLERQRGGGGFLGGPGERQIELDRRMLMDRDAKMYALSSVGGGTRMCTCSNPCAVTNSK